MHGDLRGKRHKRVKDGVRKRVRRGPALRSLPVRVLHLQRPGMQIHAWEGFSQSTVAVGPVAQDGKAEVRRMQTQLVAPSRDREHGNLAHFLSVYHAVTETHHSGLCCLACVPRPAGANHHPEVSGTAMGASLPTRRERRHALIHCYGRVHPRFVGVHSAFKDRQVRFAHAPRVPRLARARGAFLVRAQQ